MKRITIILFVCLCTAYSYGQQSLQLKMKKTSELPLTSTEHHYLIEITNTSGKAQNFNIVIDNGSCADIQQSKQVQLNNQLLNSQKTNSFTANTIGAKGTIEFYVKISRKIDTPLEKWNCTEVKAVSDTNDDISNTLTIKSLIPDPKNFN